MHFSILLSSLCYSVSTVFWFKYGFILGDLPMSIVNGVGMLLAVYSGLVYHRHTQHQAACEYLTIAGLVGILVWLVLIYRGQIKLNDVGFSAMIGSVVMFAAPLVALVHIVQRHFGSRSSSATSPHSTSAHKSRASVSIWIPREGLSLGMIGVSCAVSGSWLFYGLAIRDAFLSVPNGLGLLLSGLQLCVWSFAYPDRKFIAKAESASSSSSSTASSLSSSQNALLAGLKDPFSRKATNNSVAPFIELKRF